MITQYGWFACPVDASKYPSLLYPPDERVEYVSTIFSLMELGDGTMLQLMRDKALTPASWFDLIHQVCLGGQALAEIGVFQADLWPNNIVYQRLKNGSLLFKIIDFGYASMAPDTFPVVAEDDVLPLDFKRELVEAKSRYILDEWVSVRTFTNQSLYGNAISEHYLYWLPPSIARLFYAFLIGRASLLTLSSEERAHVVCHVSRSTSS